MWGRGGGALSDLVYFAGRLAKTMRVKQLKPLLAHAVNRTGARIFLFLVLDFVQSVKGLITADRKRVGSVDEMTAGLLQRPDSFKVSFYYHPWYRSFNTYEFIRLRLPITELFIYLHFSIRFQFIK